MDALQPFDITYTFSEVVLLLIGVALLAQIGLATYMAISLRVAARERHQLSKELFGLVRKVEGLTAHRRESILRHYDKMLETLSYRIPTTVAAQASSAIVDAESKILNRLIELEPQLKDDQVARRKMEDIVRSMEGLEQTLIALTSDTVRRVMLEGRGAIIDERNLTEIERSAA